MIFDKIILRILVVFFREISNSVYVLLCVQLKKTKMDYSKCTNEIQLLKLYQFYLMFLSFLIFILFVYEKHFSY